MIAIIHNCIVLYRFRTLLLILRYTIQNKYNYYCYLSSTTEVTHPCSKSPIKYAMQKLCKGKGMVLYSTVSSPFDRSKRFTLSSPGRPVHSNTNSASLGSILAMQQLRNNDYSLTFPPLSIARYTCIQLSKLGCQWRERKCPNFETVAEGIRTRALSIASPAFYHCATALHKVRLLPSSSIHPKKSLPSHSCVSDT